MEHRSDPYFIDFRALFAGRRSDHSVAYAACYVDCDAARDDLVLNVGSDDQSKIYLNGKEVFRCPKGRVLGRDQDQVANVVLQRGTNVLVFKVVNQTGGWQGCIRFTEQAGASATGLDFRVSP
jgi:hypothetical protein